ncbi:TPA: hypothetical protein UM358_000779 [Stenotrophomonas maltophilia]|uniref:hypothetical protein n=1 Tax=Stenotrophomonas maltophilia TaxID=40324 RepID=UPI001FA74998|nr:hypothetical protein [Stenotrophomonas maltophilia]HEL4204332.1 hypothetical protein [Stenotrophomonas maltophilia]
MARLRAFGRPPGCVELAARAIASHPVTMICGAVSVAALALVQGPAEASAGLAAAVGMTFGIGLADARTDMAELDRDGVAALERLAAEDPDIWLWVVQGRERHGRALHCDLVSAQRYSAAKQRRARTARINTLF